MSVSVILNLYKRPHALKEQYESVLAQTYPVDEILIWQNRGAALAEFDQQILCKTKFASSNHNYGVHARLAYALNAKSDYLMFLDDDVKLGPRWLEQCMAIQKKEKCLLGTIGVTCHDLSYQNYFRTGWANPNAELTQVDFCGHCWVLPREILGEYFAKAPVPWSDICGEDIGLSFAAQRLGMKSYVPPHDVNDQSAWGSLPEQAMEWGTEEHCISKNYHGSHFARALQECYNQGFKFLNF